jgi:cyclophilin family peptidyl-prolyl cis-trans isomerase
MRKLIQVLAGSAALLVLAAVPGGTNALAQDAPGVVMHTSLGDIQLELYPDRAPETVANFIEYAKSGFYDGTIFHRVIGNFMIQGGGFTPDMQKKITREPIQNEASNGLSNERGTIAMARTADPHSATAQFFINVVDNPNLDYRGESSSSTWGYAVFGRVTEGMDVVDAIRDVETTTRAPFRDVPVEPVIIEQMEIRD